MTWSLLSTLAGQPGSEDWDDPANQPPGHLGISALMFDPTTTTRFWAIVQGIGPVRDGRRRETWTPRNRGLRADWPRRTRRSASASTSSSARRSTATACTSRTTSACTAATTAGQPWTEITEGLPTEFGFAAATHPHDRDTFYVIPLDPGHGRTMPDGQAAVWRTRDAGESWQRLDDGLPAARTRSSACSARAMAIDSYESPGLYFGTSTGQVFASADEGESWSEIASYLPAISSVEVAIARLAMAEVYLPSTLTPLFPGLPRRLELDAATVGEAIDQLNDAGPASATVSASPARRSGRTSTSTSTASGRARHAARARAPGST